MRVSMTWIAAGSRPVGNCQALQLFHMVITCVQNSADKRLPQCILESM